MEQQLQQEFISKWEKYFGKSKLPICWFYTDNPNEKDLNETKVTDRCLIGNLAEVLHGKPLVVNQSTPGCQGGKRYTGFSRKLRNDFPWFLSCGIPGKVEGERYKKSPGLVDEFMKFQPAFDAPAKYLVFKRWDKIEEGETPMVVVFLAEPNVLSGLFTLANFDRTEPEGVICPFGSGCSTIIGYPYMEAQRQEKRAILGMFDVSARPCVDNRTLSFSIPFSRFQEMVENMDESFLVTESWKKVKERL